MKKEYPYPKEEGILKWISTDWLQTHLNDKNLMIIDTQPNIHDYIQEHIPGAIYFNEGLLRVPLKGIPGNYIDPSIAKKLFDRLGLKNNLMVVVYTGVGPFKGWGDGLEQTMVSYSLTRFGHNKVYVLDGGIDKWKYEGKILTKLFPKIQESDFKINDRSSEFVIKYEEFKKIKDNQNVLLLDARPPVVYEGQGPWIKPGHIPGAINLPWSNLMNSDNKKLLKPEEELKEIFKKNGVTKNKTVICSCGTGREATNEFILLKFYFGFPNVKIYEGSFTEWTSYDNPTVTGKNPR